MRVNNLSPIQYSFFVEGVSHVVAPLGFVNIDDSLQAQVYAAIASLPDLVAYLDSSLVFADGAQLYGTYNGNVVVNGNATIIESLMVNGSLTILGNLTMTGSYPVIVNGDMDVVSLFFTPSNPALSQGSVSIQGDLRFRGSSEMKCAGNETTFFVGGDFIGFNSQFDCSGFDGINGLNVEVAGDLNIEDFYCNGGDATASVPAGNGGSLLVHGNCMFDDEGAFHGGSTSFDGQNAGNGGQLNVWQNCQGYIWGPGGSSNANAWAGAGMSISVWGDFYNYYVDASGGDYNGTSSAFGAGSGGHLEIGGDMLLDDSIDINGGNIVGTIAESDNSVDAPSAGYFYCGGDCQMDSANMNGGSNNSTLSNTDGGGGGGFYVYGDLVCNSIYVNGGNSVNRNGGNAGSIRSYGVVSCQSSMNLNGGSSSSGSSNGSAGASYFYSGGSINTISFLDGTGDVGAPSNNVGFFFSGHMAIGTLAAIERTGIYVQGMNTMSQLALSSFPAGKTVFTQPNGSNTLPVTGLIGSNVFMYDLNNGWYNIPGNSLAD